MFEITNKTSNDLELFIEIVRQNELDILHERLVTIVQIVDFQIDYISNKRETFKNTYVEAFLNVFYALIQ